MNITELRDYRKWIGQTADTIFFAARNAGGWKIVFPDSLPRWASKVRNYFNLLPMTLTQVPAANAVALRRRAETFVFQLDCFAAQKANQTFQNRKPDPAGRFDPPPFPVAAGCSATADHDVVHTGLRDSIAIRRALSGQVYLDDQNRPWYQMAAGATIYHYGSEPFIPTLEAIWVTIKGQGRIPVFKLISPDGTGGSFEVILRNLGSSAIGAVSQKVDVRSTRVIDPSHQGSYNYSETTQVGLAAHEMRDVKTHVPGPVFYVNPPDPYAPMSLRTFPEKDLQGVPLAGQK